MQGAIGPESRSFRFDRDMTSDQPRPVFRQRGIDSRFNVRAKCRADVQILSRDTQSHCLLSDAGGAPAVVAGALLPQRPGGTAVVSGIELSLFQVSKGR